jgi:hypothetical protein
MRTGDTDYEASSSDDEYRRTNSFDYDDPQLRRRIQSSPDMRNRQRAAQAHAEGTPSPHRHRERACTPPPLRPRRGSEHTTEQAVKAHGGIRHAAPAHVSPPSARVAHRAAPSPAWRDDGAIPCTHLEDSEAVIKYF